MSSTFQFKMCLVICLFIISISYRCFAEPILDDNNNGTLSTNSNKTRFLVLGGNGFLGSSLVVKLLAAGKEVTVLNRGSSYFDSRTRIDPFVELFECDRYDIYNCTQLVDSTQYYESVIDLSCFYPEDMQSILDLLRGRFGRYIFISSDSVYEVCTNNTHGGPNREEDAVRPSNVDEQMALNDKDEYGHNKLECEETLENERAKHGTNYVSLRLPDVIGPRDTSDRFWNYQMWLLSHHLQSSYGPIHLHPKNNILISFALSEDVSELVLRLLEAKLDVFNEAYNVAMEEIVSLREFVEMMAGTLGVEEVSFDETEKASVYWYPSVTRGPINITKVMTRLDWKPTSMKKALEISCQFYKDAMSIKDFQERRDKLIVNYIFDKQTLNKFLAEQGVTLGQLHDEL